MIGGFQKFTLIDYPKKISSIVFVQDCNFRCPFCYNPELVFKKTNIIPEKEIFSYLEKRKKFIDAVVIGGGEPTIHKDLPDFCKKLKSMGFLVKLDTNGAEPEMLQELIKNKLVDYVAMDIKTAITQGDYNKASGSNISVEKIKQSIDLVKQLKSYEFRTTCVPGIITKEKLIKIARYLKSRQANKTFYLQQFQPQKTLNKNHQTAPYSIQELEEMKKTIEPYFDLVELRV